MHIYKYQTSLSLQEPLNIPLHAKLLKVAMQNGIPTFWFEISEAHEGLQDDVAATLKVHIVSTGQHFDHHVSFVYYDTIFADGFVWHVYVDGWILKKGKTNAPT